MDPEDAEFATSMSEFVAQLREEGGPRTLAILTHDGFTVGNAELAPGGSYARLRRVVMEWDEVTWVAPQRGDGPGLCLPLAFDFMVPVVGEEEGEEETWQPLLAAQEARSIVAPDATRAVLRFHDVAAPWDDGDDVTTTLSPLGPVGTRKAAHSQALLDAVAASRAAHPPAADMSALLDELSMSLEEGYDDGVVLRSAAPVRGRPCPLCPPALYAKYRRACLYRDPKQKRRCCAVTALLALATLVVLGVTVMTGSSKPAGVNTDGALRFAGAGAGTIQASVWTNIRTVELWVRVEDVSGEAQGLWGDVTDSDPGPTSFFGLCVNGVVPPRALPPGTPPGALVLTRNEGDVVNVCVGPVLPTGVWSHVAVTYSDFSGVALYVDAAPAAFACEDDGVPLGGALSARPVGYVGAIGHSPYGGLMLPLTGAIAHVRLWSNTQSAEAIAHNARVADVSGLIGGPLIVWYPCDGVMTDLGKEASGGVPSDTASMALYGSVALARGPLG